MIKWKSLFEFIVYPVFENTGISVLKTAEALIACAFVLVQIRIIIIIVLCFNLIQL